MKDHVRIGLSVCFEVLDARVGTLACFWDVGTGFRAEGVSVYGKD